MAVVVFCPSRRFNAMSLRVFVSLNPAMKNVKFVPSQSFIFDLRVKVCRHGCFIRDEQKMWQFHGGIEVL